MPDWLSKGWALAGLVIGGFAWAANSVAGYALAAYICEVQGVIWLAGGLAIALSLAGGVLSWLAFRGTGGLADLEDPAAGEPHRAVALISVALAGLFALVILLQAAGGLFIGGCLR